MIKRNIIKENVKETALNMISDHIIWTRLCECMSSTMSILTPGKRLQEFLPFAEYVGLDNLFFLFNLNENNDKNYIFRDSLVTSFMKIMEDNRNETPSNLSRIIYAFWKPKITKHLTSVNIPVKKKKAISALSYYYRNKEEINENKRLRYAEDREYREKQVAAAKRWRDNNPEKYGLTVEKQSLRKRDQRVAKKSCAVEHI